MCCNVHRTHLHRHSQFFSEVLLCKRSRFCSPVSFVEKTNWPYFRISSFVLTGFEIFQVCIKLISGKESRVHKLKPWLSVNFAIIFSNNRFANICELADVRLINKSFMCKHYWRASNQFCLNFWMQIFIVFFEWLKICSGRTLHTKDEQVRYCTSKLEHISTFLMIKFDHFLHILPMSGQHLWSCTRAKSLWVTAIFLLRHFLQVGINLCSVRW